MNVKSDVTLALFAVLALTNAYDVGGILSGNRMGSVPLGVTLGDGDLDVEGICQRAGPACINCTHAVTCIALPVGWLRIPLQNCEEEGLTCNSYLGGCSATPVPECSSSGEEYVHICEQVGIFPDAYDCRKFHMCSPPADYPHGRPADHHEAYCPRHYAYDAFTAQCRIKLEYGQCAGRPIPNCTHIGQSGTLTTSPNHYYVCLSKFRTLYPQIFVCPYGQYFYNNFCNVEPESIPNTNVYWPTNDVTEKVAIIEPTTEEIVNPTTPVETATSIAKDPRTEYPPDNFLADKFNLSNYEIVGDENPSANENSLEYNSFSGENYY